MIFGVGIDLVEVERVARFLSRSGARGTARVFTPGEVDYCEGKAHPPTHFAARFAAKEAAFKALGTGWRMGVAWRDVEVARPRSGGPPALTLHGRFLELAREAGITGSRLSISHTRQQAVAEVILLQGPPHRGHISAEPAVNSERRPDGFLPAAADEPLIFDPKARPRSGRRVYVAPTAVVTGDVVLADDASVWHGAVVRGDIHYIRVGKRSNIQDGAVIHVTGGERPVILGDDVSLGHGAIVHGSEVCDGTLVGMGAVVLDGAVVGAGSLVAAGSVVPEGLQVPPGSLVAGVPGRVKRGLTEDQRRRIRVFSRRYLSHKEKALEGGI